MSARAKGLGGTTVLGGMFGQDVPQMVRPGRQVHSDNAPAKPSTSSPSAKQVEAESPRLREVAPAAPEATEVEHRPEPAVEPPEVSEPAPKVRKKSQNTYRVGTKTRPYTRRDGTETRKITFTGSVTFAKLVKQFCSAEDMENSERSAFFEETMTKEIKKRLRQKGIELPM